MLSCRKGTEVWFHRTVEGYSRMLQDFFGRSGKQPDNVTSQDIFVYAHSPGLSGNSLRLLLSELVLPVLVLSSDF